MKRDDYREYLRSPEWLARRQWKLDEAEGRCQICNAGGDGLEVHHRTYERLGRERQADLVVLCPGCHEKFHGREGELSDAIEEQIIERFAAEIEESWAREGR